MFQNVNGNFLTIVLLLAILPFNIKANYDDISTEDLENLLRDIEYQEELSRNVDYSQVLPEYLNNLEYDDQAHDVEEGINSIIPHAQTRQEQLQHGTHMSYGMAPHQINRVKPAASPALPAQAGPMRGGPVLPAYCDPPNPCPHGYTEKDGCIEDFENTSDFSRRYQSEQNCLCDSEHMFNCPTEDESQKQDQRTFLAGFPPSMEQQNQNQDQKTFLAGLPPSLDQQFEGKNPYLAGTKLPIAAKKGYGF